MLSIARSAARSTHVLSSSRFPVALGFVRRMSETPTSQSDGTPAPAQGQSQALNGRVNKGQKAPPPPKKELKVLMLHGYTQSGPLFRAKTRALEKLLAKSLDPKTTTLSLHYPTGPLRLRPSDIPGYVPSTPSDPASITTQNDPEDDQLDSWAWFRRNPAEPTIRGLDEGMRGVADAIAEAGGVDGVVGFSQGGAVAGLVAAALEHPHRAPPAHAPWAEVLRTANGGKSLRFAVVYSGFYLPVDEVNWCYEPKIHTPTLHYIGGLDTVVDEGRSRGLIERCEDPGVAVHPGGHYVPISREWVMPVAGFLKRFADEMEAKI